MRLSTSPWVLSRDGVDLVDEDDGRGVLLNLLERLPEVALALALAGHLGHDLGPVYAEEEGPVLVRHRTSDQGLAGARRAIEKDALGRLDADGLEELRVTKWQLDKLPDLRQLLAHPADVIVADVIEPLLVFALDGLTLAEDLHVVDDDALLDGVRNLMLVA
jgi:hypothetical protein